MRYLTYSTDSSSAAKIENRKVIIQTYSYRWRGAGIIFENLFLPLNGVLEIVMDMSLSGFYSSALNFYVGLMVQKDSYDFESNYSSPIYNTGIYIDTPYHNLTTSVAKSYRFIFDFDNYSMQIHLQDTIYVTKPIDKTTINEMKNKQIALYMGIGSYNYTGQAIINNIKCIHNNNIINNSVTNRDRYILKHNDIYYTIEDNNYKKIEKEEIFSKAFFNIKKILNTNFIKQICPFYILRLDTEPYDGYIQLAHKQTESFILAKIDNNIHLTFKARFLLSNDLKEWHNYYDEKEHDIISFKDKSEIPKYINENCKFISTVTNEYKYMLIKAEDLYDNYTLYRCAFPDCYLTNENDIFLQDGKILINQKHTYKKMHICKTKDSSEYLDSIEVIK